MYNGLRGDDVRRNYKFNRRINLYFPITCIRFIHMLYSQYIVYKIRERKAMTKELLQVISLVVSMGLSAIDSGAYQPEEKLALEEINWEASIMVGDVEFYAPSR